MTASAEVSQNREQLSQLTTDIHWGIKVISSLIRTGMSDFFESISLEETTVRPRINKEHIKKLVQAGLVAGTLAMSGVVQAEDYQVTIPTQYNDFSKNTGCEIPKDTTYNVKIVPSIPGNFRGLGKFTAGGTPVTLKVKKEPVMLKIENPSLQKGLATNEASPYVLLDFFNCLKIKHGLSLMGMVDMISFYQELKFLYSLEKDAITTQDLQGVICGYTKSDHNTYREGGRLLRKFASQTLSKLHALCEKPRTGGAMTLFFMKQAINKILMTLKTN